MNNPLKLILCLLLSTSAITMPFILQANGAEEEEILETALTNLEETSLDIELIGTAPGKDNRCFAVILDNETKIQQICRKGDYIKGALIKQVYRDKIVLSLDGEDQLLTFADPRQVKKIPAKNITSENVTEEPSETLVELDPDVAIIRDEPSADNPDEKPRLRRIVFKNKQKPAPQNKPQ